MLVELRDKSQITIPKELINKLGLIKGDKLEIFEKDGMICLLPVTVYPKKYLSELKKEIQNTKSEIANSTKPIFDNIDNLLAKLDED